MIPGFLYGKIFWFANQLIYRLLQQIQYGLADGALWHGNTEIICNRCAENGKCMKSLAVFEDTGILHGW